MSFFQTLSDPNVQKFVTPLLQGLGAIASGYVINQLPPLQNLRQGWRVLGVAVKMAIFTMVISSWTDALGAFSDSNETKQLAGIAYGVMVFFLICSMGVDLWRLVRKSPGVDRAPALVDREALLGKVKRKCSEAADRKLYKRARITLGLEVQQSLSSQRRLSSDRQIVNEFVELVKGGTLFILGEAGVGKTTLLAELAISLIDQTDATDLDHPLPVFLELSTWGKVQGDQKPVDFLEAWLIKKLHDTYHMPLTVFKYWLHERSLVLLLDGLDEVKKEWRNVCLTAINQFQKKHGTVKIVLCSRIKEFETEQTELSDFQTAATIQPLDDTQIDDCLRLAGVPLAGVRAVLDVATTDSAETKQAKEELRVLASKPLFLWILLLAYEGQSADELLGLSESDRLTVLFDRYIEQMFVQRPTDAKTQEQMRRWLSIVAERMGMEKEFSIERMQPREWLIQAKMKWQYSLVFGVLSGLFSGLIVGLGFFLNSGAMFGSRGGLAGGLIVGGLWGGVCGLNLALDDIDPVEKLRTLVSHKVRQEILRIFCRMLIVGLILGLMLGLAIGLNSGLILGLGRGLIIGLIIGLIGGLIGGLTNGLREDITATRSTANQGIWNALNNVLAVGKFAIGAIGLIALFSYLLPSVLSKAIATSSISVILIVMGMIAWLVGGESCVPHFALRLVLYRAKQIPWDFSRFFKSAEDRLFIQRTGGSYVFVHRYLQEHFAAKPPVN
jgi:energy-coupling factor transporter ATP-binding protein EcfA2